MSTEDKTEPLLENASESSEEIPQPTGSEPNPTSELQPQQASAEEVEDSQSYESSPLYSDSSAEEQKLIKKLHASSPPLGDGLPQFGDYDIIDGIPVRIFKADSFAGGYALSDDGELFAAASTRTMSVWRRSDYTLVGHKDIDVRAISFVDGKSNVLRVLHYDPRDLIILDLKIRRSDKEGNPASKHLDENLKVIRRTQISYVYYRYKNFSDDGNVFYFSSYDPVITIYKFQNAMPLQQEVADFKKIQLTIPGDEGSFSGPSDMSPNGQSIYAHFVKTDDTSPEEVKHVIAVWPRLQFDRDATLDSVILPGDSGVWSASGEYLVVWDEDKPRLSVYKMEHLAEGNVTPIATKMLLPGLHAWQAIGLKRSEGSLLFREICKSGKERYVEWDFTKDVVIDEIFVDRKRVMSNVDTSENPKDLCPFFTEDGMDWIGSVAMDGSFAIVSRCSGAVVFNPKLPENLNLSWEYTSVRFDHVGRHFLIMSKYYILAFAPRSFRNQESPKYSTIQVSECAIWNNDDSFKPFHQLGNFALYEACSDDAWNQFWDIISYSLAIEEQIAPSSNGHWCACFKRVDNDFASDFGFETIFRRPYAACIVNLRNSYDDEASRERDVDVICITEGPHSVFISLNGDGTDRVVFMDMRHSPKLLAFDVDGQGKRGDQMDVSLDIGKCLHVCQTRDRACLCILERRAVCLFDLKTLSVQKRIPYRTDFVEVAKDWKEDYDAFDWWAWRRDHRRVSDDGRTVLLGWNIKTKQSILVKPWTRQHVCQASFTESRDHLSPFCQLTDDGDYTLFTDIDELSDDRLVIGLYSNKDLKVCKRVCHAKNMSLNSYKGRLNFSVEQIDDKLEFLDDLRMFYGISHDGSEFYTFISENVGLLNSCNPDLREGNKRWTIFATEECIPDYNELFRSFIGTTAEKVQRIFDMFSSGHVFNHPSSEGMSIFQEAFLKGDRSMVKDIVDLAKCKGFELTSRCVDKDLLTESINKGIVQNVEDAFNLKMCDQCPAKERLVMTSRDISDAMRLASRRVTKALQEDEFVVELCHIEVHTDFLNPVIRRDKGVHIDTNNEVLNWKLDDNEEVLSQKWRDDHSDIVDEMEKDGNQSKSTACVKVLCIDGAARPGPLGLVRHLLLHGVPEDVFKSRAVKWIVSWKWFKIWKPKFIRQFIWHVAFLACLTAYIIVLGSSSDLVDAKPWIKISTSVLVFVLVAYGVLMAMDEKRELMSLVNEGREGNQSKWKGVRYYFSSKWNWVDTVLCVMLLVMMPLFHVLSLFLTQCNPVLSASVAVAVLLSYIKVWYYAQPFRVTGALVLMIENIIRDCLPFLGLVSVMLIGFVLAIHVMLRSVIHSRSVNSIDQDVNDAFGSFTKGTLTLFYALFASFDSEVYAVNHELRVLVIITFGIYMVVQIIVLLNLLISIMGDTFDRVKSNEEGQMLMARAMIIDSCEASATKEEMEEIEKLTGRYIYVVEGTDDGAEDTAPGWWTGKFNMMIEKLKMIILKNKDQTESTVKEEIKTLGDEMKARMEEVVQQQAAIEHQVQMLTTEQASANSSLASALADAEARNENRIQDLSTKMDRLLSFLETQAGS